MIPSLEDGALPLGRWPSTLDEIHDSFVDGTTERRQELWAGLLQLTDALREILPVPAVWLSGSFLTDKTKPNDVDVLYILRWRDLLQARVDGGDQVARFLLMIAQNQTKPVLGLDLDTFILEWTPRSGVLRLPGAYFEDRGYWDDLWSRRRSTDANVDAAPRRGYLEVVLDGYI